MTVVPPCHADDVELPPSLRFADASRVLTGAALRLGLAVPTFRSPPRMAGASRTIRRLGPAVVADRPRELAPAPAPSEPSEPARRHAAVVAVSLRGRAFAEVLTDMIEGVIVTNRLGMVEAQRVRAELFRAASEVFDVEAA